MFTGSGIIWRFRENNNFGQFWPLCEIFLWGNAIFSSQYKTFPRPFLALIPKMELKFCSDFLKWSKIDHFWLLPENSENPNFWLWAFISQNRKRFISYEYYFVHIQSICYKLTYRVFNGFDLCFILTWPHLNLPNFTFLLEIKFEFLPFDVCRRSYFKSLEFFCTHKLIKFIL